MSKRKHCEEKIEAAPKRPKAAAPSRLVFKSNSADAPPGRGVHERLRDGDSFAGLTPGWRRKLSNFYGEFTLDGRVWATPEHYFHAQKFARDHPEFAASFTKDGGRPYSRDPKQAKQAGKAGRRNAKGTPFRSYRHQKEVVRLPAGVAMRDDFYTEGHDWAAQERAWRAKFTQDDGLRALLLATGEAELAHLVTVRGQASKVQVWPALMALRDELRDEAHDP